MIKMHNNQNILTLLFIIILIKTKNTQKALLISEDTNKALYITYSLSTTQWHIPHTPPMLQIGHYRPW